MALAKPGFISINNVPALKSTSISSKVSSGDKEVFTNLGGMDGFSDGAHTAEFQVENAIPHEDAGGYEIDAEDYVINHRDEILTFTMAGWITEVEGRFKDVDVKTSAQDTAMQSFTFGGKILSRVRR